MSINKLPSPANSSSAVSLCLKGFEILAAEDPVLCELLDRENTRQNEVLAMVAASSVADPSVLVCEGSVLTNVTTEGYPGARFHAGCGVIDEIEVLAIHRARKAFGAQYANVQPHSGSSANSILQFALLDPGDTLLGMDLDCGGHLTHGAKPSVSGRYFNALKYGVNEHGLIDYEQVRQLAIKHRPKMIIAGASAYPREIDFEYFRQIADEVGAYLLADISHISGLVAAKLHVSPIDHAHFTTTSTYKQLYGPRGGLILMGRDFDTPGPYGKAPLFAQVQRAVFPYFQGTPNLAAIAAKARALDRVCSVEFEALAKEILVDAKALATILMDKGYRVLTGGTDNHMVLIDIQRSKNITGFVAEKALESCNLVINKNRIPGDKKSAMITSGIRLGTNSMALRGMGPAEMMECANLMDKVLTAVVASGDDEYSLEQSTIDAVSEEVRQMCVRFPLPRYALGEP